MSEVSKESTPEVLIFSVGNLRSKQDGRRMFINACSFKYQDGRIMVVLSQLVIL